MRRKTVSGMMLSLLLIGMLILTFNIQPVEASGTIYIRADGSIEPSTANITSSDNVTYYFIGNIIGYSIVVERDNIVIDGAGFTLQGTGSGTGIDLTGRSNVAIKNMEIKAFFHGIWLNMSSNYNSISGNTITNNAYGIWLHGPSNNSIVGNYVTNNRGGIYLHYYCLNNSIFGNTITNNAYGILLVWSSNNTLRSNSMANNKYNFWVAGLNLSHFVNDVDASNTVDGKPVYYWINERDMAVPLDAGYVAFINCTRITVKNLNLSNNSQGVLLAYTTNSTITKNNVTNNDDGILLYYSSNNTISGNNITNNQNGINLLSSSNNTILNNNAINNGWIGIELRNSANNIISHNNVTDNLTYGIGLFDSSDNTISNNTIAHSGWGLFLSVSSNNRVVDNIFERCGMIIDGNTLRHFNTHIIENNTVNEKPIFYYKDTSHLTVSEDAGQVILANCRNITVKNINAFYCSVGIELAYTEHSIVTNNNIAINLYSGIQLYASDHNIISGNNLTNNWAGIELKGSSNCNTILNNNIDGMLDIGMYGIKLDHSSNNTISKNDAINNGLMGIGLWFSSGNNTISNNNAVNNGWNGIYLYCSNSNTVMNNNIVYNDEVGIDVWGSSDNALNKNNVTNNGQGIVLEFSSNNNTLNGNDITNNGQGVVLWYSSNNEIYHNNFIDNGYQVYIEGSFNNTWDDGYPSGGNYWSDYEDTYPYAEEIDGSGIWNTPYEIDENNQDNYPLMRPWKIAVTIPGDANGDGYVNVEDLGLMSDAWLAEIGDENFDPTVDLNFDGYVNVEDLGIMSDWWLFEW